MLLRSFIPSRGALAVAAFLCCGGLVTPLLGQQTDLDRLDQLQANRHAKRTCSEYYLAGRSPEEVIEQDHDSNLSTVDIKLRRGQRVMEAKTLVGSLGRALYRPGLGCTLLHGIAPKALAAQGAGAPVASQNDPDQPWPLGARRASAEGTQVDAEALQRVLRDAFAEETPRRERGTRAVAVVYDGQLVGERYARGFAPDQPMITWSMNKSILSALIGIQVKRGAIDVAAPAPVPEWQGEGDARAAITVEQLLHMSSGLEFEEVYETSLVDVVEMLFLERDMAAFAASQPLLHEPGSEFHYSSGTTNILARLLRRSIDGTLSDATYFPRLELFEKLSMAHTTLELDTAGNFAASSFGYSTARDLARFGQLYLQDGVWEGERILPEGWVAYTVQPAPAASRRQYGAHFWLNLGDPNDTSQRLWPSVPTDAYGLSGFEGQSVVVVPSRRAVIVRLGRTLAPDAWNLGEFVAAVLASLPLPAAVAETPVDEQ